LRCLPRWSAGSTGGPARRETFDIMRRSDVGTSQRKIEANRRNAQHSTGPRSKAGKKRSRFNAVKDGLTAKTAVVPGWESPEDFKRLVRALVKCYEPKGPVETGLVQDLALSQLKLQRAARVERNEFCEAAESAREDALDDALRETVDKEDVEKAEAEVLKRDFLVFPPSENMERLARYDTKNRRERDRSVNALNKEQRLRKKREKQKEKSARHRADDATS
jgi:hypothetical protein